MDHPAKQLADSLVKAREEYERETREDLLRRIESLCVRWRHHAAGWDVSGTRQERDQGLEKALDLLSEVHEELMDY